MKLRALFPLVVCVTQETTVLRVSGLGRISVVAALAGLDAGYQYLRTLLASPRIRVAGIASDHGMSFVAEDRVWQPARWHDRGLDPWQGIRIRTRRKSKLMTFLAGFVPKQLLGFLNPLLHPLAGIFGRRRGQDHHSRHSLIQRLWFADGFGMLADVILELLDHKSMDDLGRLMRKWPGQPLIELQYMARGTVSFVGDRAHQFPSHAQAEYFAGVGGSRD